MKTQEIKKTLCYVWQRNEYNHRVTQVYANTTKKPFFSVNISSDTRNTVK